MTDRELLEAAAKAAGIEVFYRASGQTGYSESRGLAVCNNARAWWNPLNNDGDALRLAVKLNLWEAIRMAHRLLGDEPDMYAATRRAIVRAAAAIGKA